MTNYSQVSRGRPKVDGCADEHPVGDFGQLVCLSAFLTVWYIDTFVAHFSTGLSDAVSPWIRNPLSVVLIVGGISLSLSAHRIIVGRMRESHHVVREGAYGHVRHPMYLGSLLFYLGLVVMSLSLMSAAVWVGIIVFHLCIARFEEDLLVSKFGDEYKHYMDSVPMWFPVIPRLSGDHKSSKTATQHNRER